MSYLFDGRPVYVIIDNKRDFLILYKIQVKILR